MNVAIPPEFEAFAREQVASGAFGSVDEAVAAALRNHLEEIEALRSEIRKGLDSLERGAGVVAGSAIDELILETRARHGG